MSKQESKIDNTTKHVRQFGDTMRVTQPILGAFSDQERKHNVMVPLCINQDIISYIISS
jgi:hypothetical protein